MASLLDYRDHVGASDEKFYKTTLVQSERLMLGLNCLEPGQEQSLHTHDDQDKFYLVLEGSAEFAIGDRTLPAAPGAVAWAPAGVSHGVRNPGADRLVLFMGIAPAP